MARCGKRYLFHIDSYDGALLAHYGAENGLDRWLFERVHTLDFASLQGHRRAMWWTATLVLMAGGFTPVDRRDLPHSCFSTQTLHQPSALTALPGKIAHPAHVVSRVPMNCSQL